MRVETTDISARHLGRDRWIGRLAIVALWAGAILYRVLLDDSSALALCGLPILVLGGTSALLAWNQGRAVAGLAQRGAPGLVVVGAEHIEVEIGGRRRQIRRADVVSGWTERWPRGEELVLATRGGLFLRLLVPRELRGRDVLAAVGVAPDQRARVIRLGVSEAGAARAVMIFLALIVSLTLAAVVPVAGWMAVSAMRIGSDWHPAAFMLGIALVSGFALYKMLVAPLISSTVRIGTDGVLIERLGRARLVRRDELESVTARDRWVVLQRRNGKELTIAASGPLEVRMVVEQIREAMSESGPEAQGALLDKLDRSGRSAAVWLRELRALVEARDVYRNASVSARDLLGIVKDGAAPSAHRIAAAAALSGRGDEETRSGLRVAADTCVDARLRVAFVKAADGPLDEEDLEKLAGKEDERRQLATR